MTITAKHIDNPKFSEGAKKLDYSTLPDTAEIEWAKAHVEGDRKYGYQNWRKTGVDVRTYYAAIRRHLAAFVSGESIDPDSGAHHLGHVMACAAIMVDAEHHGKLVNNWDDAEVKPVPSDGKPSLHPSVSRPVDADRIRWAVDNPLLPVPETVQSAPVAAVEPQPDPVPTEDGLWRPVAGKYGRTRDGRRVGPFKPYCWEDADDGDMIVGEEDGDLWAKDGKYRNNDPSLDLIAEWKDETPALEMREGAWYERRDGEVIGPAEPSIASSVYPWLIGGLPYTDGGEWLRGQASGRDLIREVPAPDVPLVNDGPFNGLDAQAIYDNNPVDLVGSVWENDNCSHTLKKFLPHPNYDGKILYECERLHSWSVGSLRENGYRLVRLASQEAAE